MDPTLDELVGAVDLFGGLSREELIGGFQDIGARMGDGVDIKGLNFRIDEAIEKYYLVELVDQGLLVAGPSALPELPEGGEDLPHLILVGEREINREEVEKSVVERIGKEVEIAIFEKDRNQIESLLNVCYDLEIWAGVDVDGIRKKLERIIDNRGNIEE
ncbi:MAG TPA: hypothetical protein HA275_01930 [Halobacteriales archaeon]|uniref:DUF7109 family protein n=1 Tax=Candidatus Hikarchaeum yamanae TaxID=2675326 RepID=UPI001809BDFF|nr:hypothetical protein [Halobacteriales archaeon]|tara:strand:- start:109887 stop:110366 length:480 start_codon:yes stop_codon:yes gene_type:complete